jgi:uncharacterized protein YoxC
VIASFWSAAGHDFLVAAAIIAAVAWAVLTVWLGFMLFRLAVVLEVTATTIDDLRKETVPLLSEVTVTVRSVNKELDRVDGLIESSGNIVKSAERVSAIVEQTVSSPLIKMAAASAGAARAVRRLRRERE